MKKLPDAEFEVMQIMWKNQPPLTTAMMMQQLGTGCDWRVQTLIVLLNRLIDRGFVRSEKKGKERTYYPVVGEAEYLHFETSMFIERFHRNSVTHLVATLVDANKVSDSDMEMLTRLLEDKGR